jgi:AcrR family transcriptional regulator
MEIAAKTPLAEPGRRERRRGETRNRIFTVAIDLFASQGFHKTTVEQITEAADVGKGTFFNYFPSKEAIIDEMAYSTIAGLSAVADAMQQAPTIRPLLAGIPARLAGSIGRSQIFLRSLLGTLVSNNASATHFGQIAAVARREITRVCSRGQELGELRRDRTAEQLALALQQVVWGTLLLWCIGDESDVRDRLNSAVEIFWSGAAATPGAGVTQ